MVYVQFNETMSKNLLIKVSILLKLNCFNKFINFFVLKISYECKIQINESKTIECTCIKQQIIKLETFKPLLIEFSFMSSQVLHILIIKLIQYVV